MKKTILLMILMAAFLGCAEEEKCEDCFNASKRSAGSTGGSSQLTDIYKVYPEVWSDNSPSGKTYEFKTNCFGNYSKLESCFLWNITKVEVSGPGGKWNLKKDFNINSYSGEVTRRWVLYGPQGGGLPLAGEYNFTYYDGQDARLVQAVKYFPEVLDYPTNVTWIRKGNDLIVTWIPPKGMKPGNWYKVMVSRTSKPFISQSFEWNSTSARLPGIPLEEGETAEINVAAFFRGGYSYPESQMMTW